MGKKKDLDKERHVYFDELGRIPPQNIAIEERVLGILMQFRDAYTEASQIIDESCFYKDEHRIIYNAISELEKAGSKADILTITKYLGKTGELEYVGGAYFLTQIHNKVSSPMLLSQHCIALKELAMYRKLIEIGHHLVRNGYSQEEDIFELYSTASDMLSQSLSMASDTVFTIKEAVKGVTEQMDRNCSGNHQLTGIPTGFKEFDKRSGGLQGSDLVVIAAETSQGKTSLATTITRNASLKGAKIAVYSLEMTKEQLAARLLAIETGIPANEILYSRMTPQRIEQIHQNISTIYNANIYFDERSTSSIENIMSSIRSLKIKHGIDIAVIDYLQLVGSSRRGLNREQQVADVARSLKNIAKELNINIILLSQLSRDSQSTIPKLSRLRDSGQIEEAADVVIFIYRPEVYGKQYPKGFENMPVEGTAMIDVAKGRNIGLLRFIVSFNPATTHFFEYDGEQYLFDTTAPEDDPFA